MIINHHGHYVIATPPKCGSHTANYLFTSPAFSGNLFVDGWHHNTIVPSTCNDYLKIALVRHPLARAVSLWRHHFRDPYYPVRYNCFADFLSEVLLPRQTHAFYWQSLTESLGDFRPDRLLRIEHLYDDVIATIAPVTPFIVPRINVSADAATWQYWFDQFPHQLPLAAEWANRDSELLGGLYGDLGIIPEEQ